MIGKPMRWHDGRCANCDQEFETTTPPQLDEDRMVIQQHRTMQCPGCCKDLCEECRPNGAAFRCEECGELFCADCRVTVEDMPFCAPCGAAFLDELGHTEKRAVTCANR